MFFYNTMVSVSKSEKGGILLSPELYYARCPGNMVMLDMLQGEIKKKPVYAKFLKTEDTITNNKGIIASSLLLENLYFILRFEIIIPVTIYFRIIPFYLNLATPLRYGGTLSKNK